MSQKNQPNKNRIILIENGSIYFYGDIEVQNHEGKSLLRDSRISFCRCGKSSEQPLCDNTHKEIDWKADANADISKMPPSEQTEHGKLLIKLMKDGPAILEGNYTMESAELDEHSSSKGVALCRCGASSNKPFCDGTHNDIGFRG